MTGPTLPGGQHAPTMRLRDRRSDAGVLGDITNKKEEAQQPQVAAKSRSKVRIDPSAVIESNQRFESRDKTAT